MLGMVCAIIASSIYLTIATSLGMPVSTTHSIMGGVIGMGIAAVGSKGILWWGGNINSGVTQVFLAWVLAPVIAAGFGATIFTITKYSVMLRSNPVRNAFMAIPIYFGITSSLLTMLIVWKGGASRIKLTNPQTVGVIIGVGACVAILVSLFFLPFLYCKVVKNDATLKPYHILMGPFLLRRNIPQGREDVQVVQNYYRHHQTMEELLVSRKTVARPGEIVDPEK
ncbi:phosphate transporter family-domain-containing protein [Rhexocercosporidium sp. MPI-PUGE-AT-0058]|nr:phosphate transporter family-domain-containing protein [Rhexocercosporidium sp. MPI-PUGE-AT-0058]